jgi:hypothetical protein
MKLKIAFEATIRQISILELFIDAIIRSYKILRMNRVSKPMKRHHDYLTEEMRMRHVLTPMNMIDKFIKAGQQQ